MEIAMTAILRSVLIALLLCAASYGAYAQIERQISFDDAGKIFVVSKAMNDEYKWFEPIETFLEARLFKMSDSAFVLEILRRADQGNERERRQRKLDAWRSNNIKNKGNWLHGQNLNK
jgi:hypothetical protein